MQPTIKIVRKDSNESTYSRTWGAADSWLYIYTTYLIQILEQDHQVAGSLRFKIPEVYLDLIEHKLKALRKKLVEIKAQMKELKIKVADPIRVNEEFVEYAYFPHGYEVGWGFGMLLCSMKGQDD